MDQDDDNSSEGILCSSDDEMFDGLSEAVEHHIFEQEKATRYPSADLYSAYQERPAPAYSLRSHPGGGPAVRSPGMLPGNTNGPSWGRGRQLHIGHARKPSPSSYYYPSDPPVPARGYKHPLHDGSYGDSVPAVRPSNYLSTPRADVMSRKYKPWTPHRLNPARIRREFSPPSAAPVPRKDPKYPGPVAPASAIPRRSGAEAFKEPRHTQTAGDVENRPPLIDARHDPPAAANNAVHAVLCPQYDDTIVDKSLERRTKEAQYSPPKPNHVANDVTKPGQKQSEESKDQNSAQKLLPKPIAFKIKTNAPPPLKKHHPLDPFSSPGSTEKEARPKSPEKWSHDGYEQSLEEQADETKAVPVPVSEEVEDKQHKSKDKNKRGSSKESHKRKRKESSKKDDRGHRGTDDKKHKKKNKSKMKGKNKRGSGHGKQAHSQSDEGAAKIMEGTTTAAAVTQGEAEAETVYEEEIIEEFVEDDASETEKNATPEKAILDFDVEDDDELLNLRLNALASALDAENNADAAASKIPLESHGSSPRKASKSKTKGKSKSLKSSIRKVSASSKKSTKKTAKRKAGKSSVLDMFLKKYSHIKRYQSPDSDRRKKEKRESKPDPTEMTLFGEIIKNKTKSTSEALRYIRSLPDGCKKAEMFLKLMKAEDPGARKPSVSQKLTKEANPSQESKSSDLFEDNYDEIEMELEGEEENDDHICPPGTSDELIARPLEKNQQPPAKLKRAAAEITEFVVLADVGKTKVAASHNPATPSQETIWSMLEHPTQSDSSATETPNQSKESLPADQTDAVPEGRTSRNASEETDIDESGILRLRAALLEQLAKKPDSAPDIETGSVPEVPEVDVAAEMKPLNQDVALLPSPYPYQPPTLQVQTATVVKKPVSQSERIDPAPLKPKASTNDNRAKTPSSTEVPKSIKSTPLPFLHPPQMSSTPYQLVNGELLVKPPPAAKPVPGKKKRKRRPRNRRAKKNAAVTNGVTNTPVAPPAVKTEPPKAPSPPTPKPKTTPVQPVTELKPVAAAKKPASSTSKVVFKTKTTLIKTNNRAPKRPSPVPTPVAESKRKVRVLQFPATSAPSMIALPRHRPVVINFHSSSDEEESESKSQPADENPQDVQSFMLNSLIEQVRQQTTIKPATKEASNLQKNQNNDPAFQGLKSQQQEDTNEQSWPFSLSSLPSSPVNVRSESIRNLSRNPNASSSGKLVPRVLQLSQAQDKKSRDDQENSAKMNAQLKETKMKFLKLKDLINKDESKYKRLLKIKDVKEAELKMLQDELKEMIHRVAAIKGKAARCEDMVETYKVQEAKMKERLDKRNKLKLKLKEQIKNQMIKSISAEKAQKTATLQNLRPQKGLEPPTADVWVSPLKERNPEKLALEKQRLLAVQQKLAAEISDMKRTDGPAGSVIGKRRVSLSKEVQSHLDRYKKAKKPNKPSSHDLSLSKITISSSSPVRNPQRKGQNTPTHQMSPVKRPPPATPQKNQTTTEKPADAQALSPIKADTVEKKEEPLSLKMNSSDPASQVDKAELASESSDSVNLQKLQQSLLKSMTDAKCLLVCLQKEIMTPKNHCDKFWDISYTDSFKNWKLDVGDVFKAPKEESSERRLVEFAPYTSPLQVFRSYRLSPFLRTKEKIMIKSRTFSHKLNPEKMLCRYDLAGTCNDPNCKAQHLKEYELKRSELMLDLVSYCPTLLGKNVREDMKYEELLNLAEVTCERFCGVGNKKTAMPIDDMAILIASKVNAALGNKAPFTTVFRPRSIRLQQNLRSPVLSTVLPPEAPDQLSPDEEYEDEDVTNAVDGKLHPDHQGNEDRYFPEKEAKSLRQIENTLKKYPHDVQLWLQLSNRKMESRSTNTQTSLELALHTMCLALEENPYVGELWAHYLGLLKNRKGAESDQDLDEMVSQAIELVPLSRHVWNQLLSWDCGYEKRAYLYDILISNLLKNVENNRDDEPRTNLNYTAVSRWLLQMVLQRTQLHILSRGTHFALQTLEITVKDFSQQCRNVSSSISMGTRRCLTQRDLCNLWLTSINLKYFECLPNSFHSDSSALQGAKHHLGVVVIPNTDAALQLDPKKTLPEKMYSSILTDLNVAIKECNCETSSTSCLVLLLERLHLETAQQMWDEAINTCGVLQRILKESLSSKSFKLLPWTEEELEEYLTDVLLALADMLAKKGETIEATEVFDDAVTKRPERPSEAELCFEAAMFQLNQEADVDAALLYFETCASAFLEMDGDTFDVIELRRLFHYLLRLPVPLDEKFPQFKQDVTWDEVRKQKTYLWLIYCTLVKLCEEPVMKILQAYENAIVDVSEEKNRQEIWLRYLGYRQSLAPTVASSQETKSAVLKARKTWLRNFANVVRRCIQISNAEFTSDGVMTASMQYTDHSFQNKVADIFLSCFHTRQQTSAAYTQLTDLMPQNIPLLLRACRHFLSFGDHASVVSVLWRATSSPFCQSRVLWKISIASHYARGKVAKSIRLCRRALEAVPYCQELWTDYLTLLRVHGKPEEFQIEKIRCQTCLQANPQTLLQDSPLN